MQQKQYALAVVSRVQCIASRVSSLFSCCSNVGRVGGAQTLVLGSGCGVFGIVLHEIGHAIGFWHEQSRPDRDDFVEVLINNIFPKRRHNFKKHSTATINSMDQVGRLTAY